MKVTVKNQISWVKNQIKRLEDKRNILKQYVAETAKSIQNDTDKDYILYDLLDRLNDYYKSLKDNEQELKHLKFTLEMLDEIEQN